MQPFEHLLTTMYEAFNRRDVDVVLSYLDPDVDWPNGMEGGRVHGHAAVREYWRRQWALYDPTVQPLSFSARSANEMDVEVHQVVRDISGAVLMDQVLHHVYSIHDGLIQRMNIEEDASTANHSWSEAALNRSPS